MNSIRNCADYITYLNEKGGPEGSSLDLFYESYETIKNDTLQTEQSKRVQERFLSPHKRYLPCNDQVP